ncbi:MAG: hypothetical protein ACK5II_01525 [Paracoccus sp. (in: a-proteobacteria)]
MNSAGETLLTGAAGGHPVMSRFLSRGYIAAPAPPGTSNFYAIVPSVEGTHLCAFQVKTRWNKGADGRWHIMRPKHGSIIAHIIKISHKTWLRLPGKGGRPHEDSNMRRRLPDYSKILGLNSSYKSGWLKQYLEKWDQIQPLALPVSRMTKGQNR